MVPRAPVPTQVLSTSLPKFAVLPTIVPVAEKLGLHTAFAVEGRAIAVASAMRLIVGTFDEKFMVRPLVDASWFREGFLSTNDLTQPNNVILLLRLTLGEEAL